MSGECQKCGEHALQCVCGPATGCKNASYQDAGHKWISIEDRMPEHGLEVLCANKIHCWVGSTQWSIRLQPVQCWTCGNWDEDFEATHWMPLPPPPKPTEDL